MPFYEYECTSCGHREEVLQKITDKPLKTCPSCGKSSLRKLMSAPVFRLKGSGWYETDFKSDKENKRNLAGADKEEPKSETKGETKGDAKAPATAPAATESKPEAKAETRSGSKPAPKPAAVKKTKARPAAARRRPRR